MTSALRAGLAVLVAALALFYVLDFGMHLKEAQVERMEEVQSSFEIVVGEDVRDPARNPSAPC